MKNVSGSGIFILSGIFLCLALLAGCSSQMAERSVIRVGITPFTGYAYLYLAEEKGFLAESGFDIQLVNLNSLADMRTAYERGQVDVIPGTLMEQLVIMSKSRPDTRAFFVLDYSMGADMLVARPPYTSVADLKGKKVAFEPETVDVVVLHWALKSAGLTLKDIVPAPMSQLEIPNAIRTGQIDAAEVYPPFSTAVLRSGAAVKVFDTARIPLTIIDVLMADYEFTEKNQLALAALVRVFYKAKRYAADHPEESAKIIASRIGINESELKNCLAGTAFVELDAQTPLLAAGGAVETKIKEVQEIFDGYGIHYRLDPGSGAATTAIIEKCLQNENP